MFGKKKKKVAIAVNDYEYHLILDALFGMREKLMAEGRYTDGIDETIMAVSK